MPSHEKNAPRDDHVGNDPPLPTFVSRLTPPGAGAIATLSLAGAKAGEILSKLFHTNSAIDARRLLHGWQQHQRTDRVCVGRLGDPTAGMDEVVLAAKQWQPIPVFEIHCHGGEQVTDLLIECLVAHGAQNVDWEEMARFLGEPPLSILARRTLSQVSTIRTASIVIDQLHGAFARVIEEIKGYLKGGQTAAAQRRIGDLLRWSGVGRHLVQPWKVVVAGPPNVGKSSLINRLAGYQRCVVSHEPGTTRDLVAVRLAIEGWPMEFVDSAGRRDSTDPVEHAGVQLALRSAEEADLVLWVEDCRDPSPPPTLQRPVIRIRNKIDLGAATDGAGIFTSAKTGEGVDRLIAAIATNLVPESPPAGAAVPFTPWLCDELEETRRELENGPVQPVLEKIEEIERQPR